MSDERIRELERQMQSTGSPEDTLAWRMARIRAGLERLPETTYSVLELHLKSLQKKVAGYARRAHKSGQIPLALHVGAKTWVDRERSEGGTARLPVYDVTLIGDSPVTEDWEFIAALHHTPSGTIIQRAYGCSTDDFPEEDLEIYRQRDSRCDDCELRRKRNDTYVLRHRDDGRIMQIGRSCLASFLSCSPEAALYQFRTEKVLTEMLIKSDELDDTAKPEWGAPLEFFLTHLCRYVRDRGHMTRSMAGPSWDAALRGIYSGTLAPIAGVTPQVLLGTLSAEDHMRALAIRGAAQEHLRVGDEALSQDLHNVAVIVGEDTVSRRHCRIAARLIPWYEAREREEAAEARRAARTHLTTPEGRCIAVQTILSEVGYDVGAAGTTVAFPADELIRLILANGTLDAARNRIRAITGAEPHTEADGNYLAPQGNTGTWDLTVTRTRSYSDRYNGAPKIAVVLQDRDDRQAVWFANREDAATLKRGDQLTVTANVYRQGHSRYNRQPETVINQVQWTVGV